MGGAGAGLAVHDAGPHAGPHAEAQTQRHADGPAPGRSGRPDPRRPWVQRCGIGSSCTCGPADQLAGIRRDLHAHHGGPSPAATAHTHPGVPAGDRRLAHDLSHVMQPAADDRAQRRPREGSVGPADDEYEREAHAVAASVVHGLGSRDVGPPTAPPAAGAAAGTQRLCESCQAGRGGPDQHGEGHRSAPGPGSAPAPDALQALVGSPPAGSAVPEHVRSVVEPVLGADLSGVQVHADPVSQGVAGDIGARAFTHGGHVFLGAGESAQDVAVMAHELTHTVQQGASPASPAAGHVQRWPSLDDVADFVADAAEGAGDMATSAAGAVGDAVDTAGEALEDASEAVYEVASDVGQAAYDVGAGAVGAVADAADWLTTEAGEALGAIADWFGGRLSITDEGIVVTLPDVCIADPFTLSAALPDLSGELMVPIGGLPLGPVVLVGEIGVAGHLEPTADVRVGPVCLRGIRIVADPFSLSSRVSGSVTAAATASLGSEVRGGVRGDLSLTGIIPVGGVPVPISVPLIGLEGGLAGLFRGSATGNLVIDAGMEFGLGGISLTEGAQLGLAFGADMFLGAYGQLDILGQDVCRIYWQPVEWHGAVGGAVGVDLSVSILPGGPPLISPVLQQPVLTDPPLDQLPRAVTGNGFADVCPIKDALCEVLTALHLLPSQNGGVWDWTGDFGPGPRLPGPLECYLSQPPRASGSRCRGACGPDCDTCTSSPVSTVTDPATGEAWTYINLHSCHSNEGCRDHDAAFDWAAEEPRGETGDWAIVMPWHMAANIECGCNNLAGDCIAWIAGLPPYDSAMYFADSVTQAASGGRAGITTDCRTDFPDAPDCLASFPDRDTTLADWGATRGVTGFRDCRVAEAFVAVATRSCAGAAGRVWNCAATDVPSGRELTVSVVECICCNEDGTNGSEWRDPAVQIDGGMTEDFILDLCARGLVPRVICLPLEEDVLRRFGRRRDPNVDPDEDPKTVLRPDDAPIFDSFRRMYNRLDSWTFFIAGHHPELTAEFDAKFALEVKRGVWLAALKERTVTFKETFRDLRDSDPERARRAYQDAVLGGIEAEITATVREIGDWFKDRTGSTEPIGELLQRVHDAGTELWREAWRAASLQVNRVLARLWPPAKTQILVWVGQERRKHPDVDLSGNVEELDYIGSLATGFKGPPKQHIRFNPRKFDVDANLEAPPLEKYAVAVDRLTPDRKRIFGNDTTIVPLKDFSARTHAELVAQVTGYDAAPPPFDVAIDAAEPPGQTRVRLATERLFALREALSTARYEQLIGEITASGFLDPLGAVRGDLSETDAVRLNAIMDRFDPPGANPPAPARP